MLSLNSSQVVLPENWQKAGFGLYIHWPFCSAKCPYCDFNSHVSSHIDQGRWRRAYVSEIKRVASETSDRVLSSVFFGGGTPSLMEPETVDAILSQIRSLWTLSNDFEVTLEANPTSVESARFSAYKQAGVNRVSMGFQALNDPDLKNLGRLHTLEESLVALEVARSCFDRVNFDLIYARQGQTLADWEHELTTAIAMSPDHLSLYQLTIEEGTAFGDRYNRGKLNGLPDDDLGADLYLLTQELCESAGLPAYEVSNHAKPQQECRHNLIYWNSGDYAGIGPGAHGRLTFQEKRFSTDTPKTPTSWLMQVEQKNNGEMSRDRISVEDARVESIMMGLRMTDGIELSNFSGIEDLDHRIDALLDQNLIVVENSIIKTTDRGRLLLNPVLSHLLV